MSLNQELGILRLRALEAEKGRLPVKASLGYSQKISLKHKHTQRINNKNVPVSYVQFSVAEQ